MAANRGENMNHEKREKLVELLVRERMSVRKAADCIGVSHMTAYRALSEMEII